MNQTADLRNFRDDFAGLCREHENSRAILDSKTGRVWTYGMLRQAVFGAAAALARAGVGPGDRVFSILPNSPEQFVFFLGAWTLGADFCPVSPLSTAAEAARFAKLCRSAVGLVPQQMDPAAAAGLKEACGRGGLLTVNLDGDLSRWFGAPVSARPAPNPGRLVLFTSGTVSEPKAIVLDADRLWSSAVAWTRRHPFLTSESRFYNILPMSYLGGLFNLGLIPLACGGSFVLGDAFTGLTALKFWREVLAQGVNVLWLAPTMMRTLLSLHKPDPEATKAHRQVRAAFAGMAPMSREEKETFEKTFGFPILENFALSETTFLTSERLENPLPRSAGSTGQVLPWVELKLAPAEGEAPAEILVKSPFLFLGYLDRAGGVTLPLTPDGFFATGDLGALDDAGTLVIKGRSRDIIKKGGYLLVLRELEEAAQDHPAVADAAAVGVPHDFYGESAVVFVKLSPGGGRQELEAVAKHLTAVLAKFKWPSEVVAVTDFPKTESGKTRKKRLLDLWRERKGELTTVALR